MIISIAPMLKLTNHYFRYLIRLISEQVLLYTEMVTTPALLRGSAYHLLYFTEEEKPISIQLAGNDANDLAICAKLAADKGYDAINLNVGCPSRRIQAAEFGACLMRKPERVADCVNKMCQATHVPITVKMRLSAAEHIDEVGLYDFINLVSQAGCKAFIIHARGAVLSRWSPRANRSKFPLHYKTVYQVQKKFPHLSIVLNGGITDFYQAKYHLDYVRGVMIGQAAYKNPYMFADCDRLFYHRHDQVRSREEVAQLYLKHIHQNRYKDVSLTIKLKPLFNLYHGKPHIAALWRKKLAQY